MLETFKHVIDTKPRKQRTKLPSFYTSLQMINQKMKKKPWHNYKRGRKRHGKYRKALWCKTAAKNAYEPRVVPRF